jgi:nucleotide-binding universal stress UspA family protein
MVPTDFSEFSDKAFEHALNLARQYNAELYLFHVVSDIQQCAVDYCLTEDIVGQYRKTSIEGAKTKLQDEIGKHPEARDIKITGDVKIGTPYHEILVEAADKGIDLIVIATHGKGGLLRQMMGSVAERVLRGAKCPVMLMRF